MLCLADQEEEEICKLEAANNTDHCSLFCVTYDGHGALQIDGAGCLCWHVMLCYEPAACDNCAYLTVCALVISIFTAVACKVSEPIWPIAVLYPTDN